MRKQIVVLLVLCMVSSFALFAGGAKESKPVETAPQLPEETVVTEPAEQEVSSPSEETDTLEVHMSVFKGPTGFGYVKLIEDGPNLVDGISVTTSVLPSPTEAVARLISGELDVLAMPVNTAAALYAKGVDIRIAAVTGEGMMYLISALEEGSDLSAFEGMSVNIPGAGSTPEYVSRYLFEQAGVSARFDFSVNVAAQLAGLLVAGKVPYAILPEPFATMALSKNPALNRSVDLQELFAAATGKGSYPMTALVFRGQFAASHPQVVSVLRMAVEDSISWVNSNPKEASVLIEKHEILTAALAEPAIPNCALVYKPVSSVRDAIEAYYSVLMGFDPASIGGALPDEAFYMAQ